MGQELKDGDEELAKKTPPLKWPLLRTIQMTQWSLRSFLGQANGQMGEDSKQTPSPTPPSTQALLRSVALTCVVWGCAHTMSDSQPQLWGRRKSFSGKWPEEACHWLKKDGGGGGQEESWAACRPLKSPFLGYQGVLQPLCKVGWEKAHGAAQSMDSGVRQEAHPSSAACQLWQIT